MTQKRIIEAFILDTIKEMQPLINQLKEASSNTALINRILINTSGSNLQKLTVALTYLVKHESDPTAKATLENLHQSVDAMSLKFQSSLEESQKIVEENQKKFGEKPSPAEIQKANDYSAYAIIYKEPTLGEKGNLDKLLAGLSESKERYETLISEIKRRSPDEKVSSAMINKLEREMSDFSIRNNKDQDYTSTQPKHGG